MKEQFADYETAKMLKELGYSEKCLGFYYCEKMQFEMFDFVETTNDWEPNFINNSKYRDDYVSAPLWQQAKQWLWEKHKIRVSVQDGVDKHKYTGFAFTYNGNIIAEKFFNDSPITAEIEGIKSAITHLHQQK